MKRLSVVIAIPVLVMSTFDVFAGDPTAAEYGVVLNLSGRQRMLSQKMAKEALLVASGIDATENRTQLAKTMRLFEKTLAGLRDGSSEMGLPATQNKRIVKQLDKVRALYEELQSLLSTTADGGTPTDADLTVLAEKNLPLLKQMNKAVKMYERASKGSLGGDKAMAVVINMAGRQRMLTQKMSKEALLVYLGINADENRLNVRETGSLFDRALKGLLDGDSDLELAGTKEPEIRNQLKTVKGLWQGFKPIVARASDPDTKPSESDMQKLGAENLPLLREMNKAVKMYEALAKG